MPDLPSRLVCDADDGDHKVGAGPRCAVCNRPARQYSPGTEHTTAPAKKAAVKKSAPAKKGSKK